MSVFPGLVNPVLYAQFQVRGGWKNTLSVAAVYAVLIGGAIWGTAHAADNRTSFVLNNWAHGLLILQMLGLLVYGTSRVNAAVRADVTGRLLESHRLMPMSGSSVVLGYLLGAPAQAIVLVLVNVVLGIFTCSGAGIHLENWFTANFMLGAFALLVWIIALQMAFSTRGGFVLIIISVLIAAGSNGAALMVLPGISVLTCPIVGRPVFLLRDSFSDLSFAYGTALLSQTIVGVICFAAAARKYRRGDGVGFSPFLGLLLLAAVTGISILGLLRIDEYVIQRYMVADPILQFVGSLIALMLIALIPITSAARFAGQKSNGDAPVGRRTIPTTITALAAAVIVCAMLWANPTSKLASAEVAETVIEVFAFVISLALLFRWAYLGTARAWWIGLLWLVPTWLFPPVVDSILRTVSNRRPEENVMGLAATFSPPGAIIAIWNHNPKLAVPGVAFHVLLIAIPATLLLITNQRRRNRRAKTAAAELPAAA